MKVAYLKIGNSNIALMNKARIGVVEKENFFSSPIFKALRSFDEVWVVSVVPSVLRKLRKALPRVKFYEARRKDFSIHSLYASMGLDRILNIFAGQQLVRGAFCVIDLGTAITVDFVSAERQHLGGWILPGPTLWMKSLHENTALLPVVAPRKFKSSKTRRSQAFGSNTFESIQLGYLALLRGIMTEANKVARDTFRGKSYKILFTGGWSDLASDFKGVRIDHLGLKSLPQLRALLRTKEYGTAKVRRSHT